LGHNPVPPLGFWIISLKTNRDAAELSTEGYESSEVLPFGPPAPQEGAGLKPLRSLPLYG